ncbi:MAG: c-type cytochrome [Gemmatimonadales bacterium]
MWRTNLKVLGLVICVLGLYTLVANSIPQIQSEVPKQIDMSGDITPQQLVAIGEGVFNGAGGCTACHGLGTRAPNLLTNEGSLGPIGSRCSSRKPGMSCKDYLFESITKPAAYVVPGYQPIMPDMTRTLPAEQVWAVIAFLESQGGTVDVTADDVHSAMQSSSSNTAAAAASPSTTSLDPRQIINANGCLGCHSLHGQGGAIAPHFDGVGTRRTADGIRAKILAPASSITPGFEKMAGIMPATFGQTMTAAQLEALVNFLSSLK